MSLFNTLTKTNEMRIAETRSVAIVNQLPQFILSTGLGLLGGAVGVALTIGLAILAQLLLFPTAVFAPGALPLALVAVITGLGLTWLFSRIAPYLLPSLSGYPTRGIQVMFVFSTLTSLLQTFLYVQGV